MSLTDFNDLARVAGQEEVMRQVEKAINAPVPEVETQKPEQEQASQWEEPLLFGEMRPPAIPASTLPVWLGEYVKAVAETTQTPESMATMLALSAVATCLQGRFEVSPRGDDYREPVNLWTVTALPPGSRKTAVIRALTAPLSEWEREQEERLEDEISRSRNKRKVCQARIDKLTKKAATEDDPQQREVLLQDIRDVEKEMPEEMSAPRLWTADVTPERLQGLLVEHGERMAVLSDEGGIFEVMAGLYNDGKVNLDVFLQAHAGQSVRVDRTSRTAHLESPVLTFGLAVQPSVIADLSQGSKKRFRGNGALARFLFCLPENNVGKRDVRKHAPIPEIVKARYYAGIAELLNIAPEKNAEGREQPRLLTLEPDARECWLDFSQTIESKQGEGGDYESIQDWTGKLPGAALRIAGLLHVVEYGITFNAISLETMERALFLAALLVEHAKAAFDLMGADQATSDGKAIYQWITDDNRTSFTKNEVRRALKGRWEKKPERLDRALSDLVSRDIIGEPIKVGTGGRPASVYQVNPRAIELEE